MRLSSRAGFFVKLAAGAALLAVVLPLLSSSQASAADWAANECYANWYTGNIMSDRSFINNQQGTNYSLTVPAGTNSIPVTIYTYAKWCRNWTIGPYVLSLGATDFNVTIDGVGGKLSRPYTGSYEPRPACATVWGPRGSYCDGWRVPEFTFNASINVAGVPDGNHWVCVRHRTTAIGPGATTWPPVESCATVMITRAANYSAESRIVAGGVVNPPRALQPGERISMQAGINSSNSYPRNAQITYTHWFDREQSGAATYNPAGGDMLVATQNPTPTFSINWSGFRSVNTRTPIVPDDYARACTYTLIRWVTGGTIQRRESTQCTTIAYKPKLTPLIQVDPARSVLLPGDTMVLKSSIVNSSHYTARSNADTRWWLDKNGNGVFDAGDKLIDNSSKNGATNINGMSTLDYMTLNFTAADGGYAQVCGELILNNVAGSPANNYIPSNTARTCWPMARVPWVSVSGGDVASRDTILTESRTISGNQIGSWVEYGAFAKNQLTTYTAAGLARPQVIIPRTAPNKLAFANTPTNGSFADIPAKTSFDVNFTSYPVRTVMQNSVSIDDLEGIARGDRVKLVHTGDLVITGGQVKRTLIVQATGKITISGNVTYQPGPYASIAALPQFVVMAGTDVVVNKPVTQIDGWVQAGRKVTTCDTVVAVGPYYSGLNRNTCDTQLVINGPVSAQSIQLRRTAGGESSQVEDQARVAEAINLRNDTYMWAYSQAQSADTTAIRTTYVSELSPRY